jgi:nitrogen regulatory protein PII-like uncharacterized protein
MLSLILNIFIVQKNVDRKINIIYDNNQINNIYFKNFKSLV